MTILDDSHKVLETCRCSVEYVLCQLYKAGARGGGDSDRHKGVLSPLQISLLS